jgi:hypothetical protein
VSASADGVRTVDIGRWQRQQLSIGALVPTLLGLSAVVAAIAGLTTDDSTGERIIVGVLGALFLAVGVGLYTWLFRAPPQGWLDLDDSGITRRDRKGVTWHLDWAEIKSAALVRSRLQVGTSMTFRQAVHFTVAFPRYFLRLMIDGETARRLQLRADEAASHRRNLSAPVDFAVDLGVPPGPAEELLAILGPRLTAPEIVRLPKAERVTPSN